MTNMHFIILGQSIFCFFDLEGILFHRVCVSMSTLSPPADSKSLMSIKFRKYQVFL